MRSGGGRGANARKGETRSSSGDHGEGKAELEALLGLLLFANVIGLEESAVNGAGGIAAQKQGVPRGSEAEEAGGVSKKRRT